MSDFFYPVTLFSGTSPCYFCDECLKNDVFKIKRSHFSHWNVDKSLNQWKTYVFKGTKSGRIICCHCYKKEIENQKRKREQSESKE